MTIDVNFDFTTDTPGYWETFWTNPLSSKGNKDPDNESPTLRSYHRILWNKELPNGELFDLSDDLTWKNMRFSSDSLLVSFRYEIYHQMIEEVAATVQDWNNFIESFVRRSYTIGGEIIFPKRCQSINQCRGCNKYIRDRWDLTLDCIRKYYDNEKSPLSDCLEKDRPFFDLFIDFKGYVDFFYLQDCVSNDYGSIIPWSENSPFPESVDEYLRFIDDELRFVNLRNKRIERSMKNEK